MTQIAANQLCTSQPHIFWFVDAHIKSARRAPSCWAHGGANHKWLALLLLKYNISDKSGQKTASEWFACCRTQLAKSGQFLRRISGHLVTLLVGRSPETDHSTLGISFSFVYQRIEKTTPVRLKPGFNLKLLPTYCVCSLPSSTALI